MFSKNNYLLPQYFSSSSSSSTTPSSLYPRPNASLVDLNNVEFLFHHHPEMFPGQYYLAAAAANTPPFVHAAAMLNQDDGGTLNGEAPSATAVALNSLQRKQPVKKDRHSKIFTAQGPRDRRVRLSIGIARKFFDLQEMLGFDKPSKTLDWLLTKSKAAIKELVQMKENASCANKSASSPSECELISSESHGDTFEIGADTKKKSVKESRAKARARARERTKEKMSIKNNMGSDDLNPLSSVPIQYRNNQVDLFQSSAAGAQDLIQESTVVKRKMKSPSFFGYQQNVFVSRDLSSNYGVPSANNATNNAPENWDICSFTSQSNLCATLDQHKFINSSSNM